MKKQLFGILALIVSITLLISLVSCSNKPSGNVDDDAPLVRDDSTGSTSAPENNAGNVPDFSAIIAGNGGTDTVWGNRMLLPDSPSWILPKQVDTMFPLGQTEA